MAPRRSHLIRLALLALCAAYIQGPLTKLADWPGAIAEMEHFGLRPAAAFAAGVIVFEMVAAAMVVTGIGRRPAAIGLALFTCAATLLALRFWELPPGPGRSMATNAFFEHLGLAGAFVFVALREPDHPLTGVPA
ncbi:MAG: DoxX family protein [Alsobacter sp.]